MADGSNSTRLWIAVGVLAIGLVLWLVTGDGKGYSDPAVAPRAEAPARLTDPVAPGPGAETASPSSVTAIAEHRSAAGSAAREAEAEHRSAAGSAAREAEARHDSDEESQWERDGVPGGIPQHFEPTAGELAALESDSAEDVEPSREVLEELYRESEILPPQDELDELRWQSEQVQPTPEQLEQLHREAEVEPSPERLAELIRQLEME